MKIEELADSVKKSAGKVIDVAHEQANRVSDDAHDLMGSFQDGAAKAVRVMRGEGSAQLQRSYRAVSENAETLKKNSQNAFQAVNDAVKDHPYASIAIGAGIGFVMGKILTKKQN